MSDTKYIDFAKVKESVCFEQAIDMLGLKMKKSGGQFRSSCPVHGGGERTLVVTPNKGFYCFANRQGGDQIALVAHVRNCNNREAAAEMREHFGLGPSDVPQVNIRKPSKNGSVEPLKPLDYLTTDHEALELLQLTPAVCEAIGIGYAGKGSMNGRIAFPLRLQDGTLVGYVGLATKEDQAPLLKVPENLAERIAAPVAEEPEEPSQKGTDIRRFLRVV